MHQVLNKSLTSAAVWRCWLRRLWYSHSSPLSHRTRSAAFSVWVGNSPRKSSSQLCSELFCTERPWAAAPSEEQARGTWRGASFASGVSQAFNPSVRFSWICRRVLEVSFLYPVLRNSFQLPVGRGFYWKWILWPVSSLITASFTLYCIDGKLLLMNYTSAEIIFLLTSFPECCWMQNFNIRDLNTALITSFYL